MQLRRIDDPAAWSRFVRLYSPILYGWAIRMGSKHADALDLVQDVFATLVQKLPEFAYQREKGFRNWLFRVTKNKFLEKRRRKVLPVDLGTPPDAIAAALGDGGLESRDLAQYLLVQVLPSVESLFQPSTWKAFWLHVVEGKSATEVAEQLGITANGVFKAKARVLARLHQELADLTSE